MVRRHAGLDPTVVVGINIHLQTVSRLLHAEGISPNARAYIVNGSDALIAHSDPGVMEKLLRAWMKDPGTGDTTADSLDTSLQTVARLRHDPAYATGGLARLQIDGAPHLIQLAPVEVSGLF